MFRNEAGDCYETEWDDLPRRRLRRGHRDRDEFADTIPCTVDPEKDLLGCVYRVPDAMWGFWAPFRDWHPGVCVFVHPATRRVTLLKGTSQVGRVGPGAPTVVIEPTTENGLEVPTAFILSEVRQYRPRRVALLHLERRLGRIETPMLLQLQDYLRRVFHVADLETANGAESPELLGHRTQEAG